MFRFTIRDVLWLMTIAAGSLRVGLAWLRADNVEEYAVTFAIFLAGVACYAAVVVAWRWVSRRKNTSNKQSRMTEATGRRGDL